MPGYPCCCSSESTITPCSGSTLLINRADYELHIQFHSGSYVSECDSCDKLESTTFILTWDAVKLRWGYTNATFGDACSSDRRIDIGLINSCSSGKMRLQGKAFSDGSPLTGVWFIWGGSGTGTVCLFAGKWTSVNTGTCSRGTELSFEFPDADVTLNTWYEAGALDVPCDDSSLATCDCGISAAGLGNGPQARVMFVEA
jgi:hypothetical protein